MIGVEAALNIIVSGEPVKSEFIASFPVQKLFDKVIEGDLMAGAIAFALEKADVRPLPLVRDMKVGHPEADAYFKFALNTVTAMAKNFPAPRKCRGAERHEDEVRRRHEGRARNLMNLMFTPECVSLRHLFIAERAASKIPDVPEDTKPRDIKKVGVIGAGTMGGGIAMNFLNAGVPVIVLEMKQEAIDKGFGVIRKITKRRSPRRN